MSEWVFVATVDDLGEGDSRVVEVDRDEVLVCVSGGEWHAVENRCSHDDGPLDEGVVAGDEVTCPRHGARFDLTTGAALCMPAVTPIRVYEVRIDDDRVYVRATD